MSASIDGKSYTFTHALCREPSPAMVDGLRAVDIGTPDFATFRQHHMAYVNAIRATGANVTVLEPLDAYPDSVFIEDDALCLREGALIMRPGAPSRLGEVEHIREPLDAIYSNVRSIDGPGFIEGGDILVTETEILVGRSARTDAAGVAELTEKTRDWGYIVREVNTPADVLHFKTDCSLLDSNTIFSTERLARTGCFDGYEVILTPEGEEAAANCIRFNTVVLLPDNFPKSAEILSQKGYAIQQIGNSEAAKLDGGMSCLSLRFTPS